MTSSSRRETMTMIWERGRTAPLSTTGLGGTEGTGVTRPTSTAFTLQAAMQPSGKAYSGSRSEEICIPWKPHGWPKKMKLKCCIRYGGGITEVLYHENGADKHDKIWRCYILYENCADKHDKIITMLYTLRKRCRWTWQDHSGAKNFTKTVQMDMTRSLRCYILYENGADKHDKITAVLYTLRKRCRWTWQVHWSAIYFMKTVQMDMTRSLRCYILYETVQINMTRSLQCYILHENGADEHDKITEVLYTLWKRRRWTWPDQRSVICFMKTVQMDMNTSLRCYILSENGANEHDKISDKISEVL